MKTSQNDKIMNHLKKYGSITTWTAFTRYNITRLAARIWDIRNDGFNVFSKEEN